LKSRIKGQYFDIGKKFNYSNYEEEYRKDWNEMMYHLFTRAKKEFTVNKRILTPHYLGSHTDLNGYQVNPEGQFTTIDLRENKKISAYFAHR